MTELVNLLKEAGWSWVLWLVVAVFVIKTLVDMAAETSEGMEKALGWYGRRIAARRKRREDEVSTLAQIREDVAQVVKQIAAHVARMDDMQRQVDAKNNAATNDQEQVIGQLAFALRMARWRQEMTDAYLDSDADFHRSLRLAGITDLPAFTPFPDHEREWVAHHPKPQRRRTDQPLTDA